MNRPTEPSLEQPVPSAATRRRRRWPWLVLVVALGTGGYFGYRYFAPAPERGSRDRAVRADRAGGAA